MPSSLIFLELTPENGPVIKGEATATGFEDLIEVDTVTFGAKGKAAVNSTSNTARAQKPRMEYETVDITRPYDSASPRLMVRHTAGHKFKTAKFTFDRPLDEVGVGKQANPILRVTLFNVYIDSFKVTTSPSSKSSAVNEEMSLSFDGIEFTYYPQSAAHDKRQGAVTYRYDRPRTAGN